MCWRHLYIWSLVPAGQPRLLGRTIELMVCSSGRTLGLLNLAVGADSNGFLGTHTHTHTCCMLRVCHSQPGSWRPLTGHKNTRTHGSVAQQ